MNNNALNDFYKVPNIKFDISKLKLDLSMANLDSVRNPGGFGQTTKEGHAFIIFKF
jgi:hypothetical protein